MTQMKEHDEERQKEINEYRDALKKKEDKIEALYKDNLVKENLIIKKDKHTD